MEMTDQLYFGGIPTGPEVRKLQEAFGNISDRKGTTIRHEDIEGIIDIPRDSNRYRTVINAWRRKVASESGVEIRGDLREVVGVGFRILSDSEQISFGVSLRNRGGKKIRHSHRAIFNTDDKNLSAEERRIKEHGILAARHIHAAIVESRRFLPSAPDSPESRPSVPTEGPGKKSQKGE
jgi:hypothetical protein